jgi:hypothetical protein
MRATVSLLTLAQVAIVQPSMLRRVIDALSRQQLVLFENNLALEKSSAPRATADIKVNPFGWCSNCCLLHA